MDKKPPHQHSDNRSLSGNPDLERRNFVRRSGRALYLVPTLSLLGPATASAQGSGCPNPDNPFCPPGDQSNLDLAPAPDAPPPPDQ